MNKMLKKINKNFFKNQVFVFIYIFFDLKGLGNEKQVWSGRRQLLGNDLGPRG
jgi:hypothetical protein